MNSRLSQLQTHPTVRLEAAREAIRARDQRLYDFGVGDPREPTPSFVREALVSAVPAVSGYATTEGTPGFRRAAAGYLARRFGVAFDPDREILSTAGSKEAIFHLPMVLVDGNAKQNRVVFGEPAYAAFRIGTCFAGAVEHPVPLSDEDRYLLTPERVGDDVLRETAIVFLNYPHNPSGQDMPADVFRSWIEARDRFGFVIVSDEVYVDLFLDEAPHSLLEFGREGCIAAHSLSKRSGMTGYLTGFLAGDERLLRALRKHRASMGLASPPWIQAAAEAAWNDDGHVIERRAVMREKHAILRAALERCGLRIYPGNASLFVWARVPNGTSDVAYAARLAQAGIVVAPGTMFGPEQQGFIRLAMAPALEACREAAALWPAP